MNAALKLSVPVDVGHYDVKTPGQKAAEMVADLRFRQKAAKVHALGVRATTELLAQIAVLAGALDVVDGALDDFCRLDAKTLRAVGGDRLPPLPIREVA